MKTQHFVKASILSSVLAACGSLNVKRETPDESKKDKKQSEDIDALRKDLEANKKENKDHLAAAKKEMNEKTAAELTTLKTSFNASLQGMNSVLTTRVNGVEKAHNTFAAAANEYFDSLYIAVGNQSMSLATAKEDIEKMQRSISAAQTEIAGLQKSTKDAKEVQEKVNKAQTDLNLTFASKKQIEDLQSAMKDAKEAQEKVNKAQADLNTSFATKEGLSDSEKALATKLTALDGSLKSLISANDKKIDAVASGLISNLKTKASAASVSELQTKFAEDLKKAKERSEAADKEIKDAKASISKLAGDLESARSANEDAQQEINSLRDALGKAALNDQAPKK